MVNSQFRNTFHKSVKNHIRTKRKVNTMTIAKGRGCKINFRLVKIRKCMDYILNDFTRGYNFITDDFHKYLSFLGMIEVC